MERRKKEEGHEGKKEGKMKEKEVGGMLNLIVADSDLLPLE